MKKNLNTTNFLNARRRMVVKDYLAGKKKNILGVKKNKKQMIASRQQLVRNRNAARAVAGSEGISKQLAKARNQRSAIKQKATQKKVIKKVQKQMGMGYGIYA